VTSAQPSSPIVLRTASAALHFDPETGRPVSLRPAGNPEVDLLATSPAHPVFALQYLSEDRQFVMLDSHSAREASVQVANGVLVLTFFGVGGLDVDVTLTVRADEAEPMSRWSCTVRNGAGLRIVDVQFPFVVVREQEGGSVLLPAGHGELWQGDMLRDLPLDVPERWRLIPPNGNSPHYPGRVFAQFAAWCGPEGGVYLAAEDTEGNVKLISALRRDPGIRLGMAHVGDWPTEGTRTLEYDVLVGCFEGDWTDAADIYRTWSLQQHWATPLSQRRDVPRWLLDSPPHITIRLQGYVDAGPAPLIEPFIPYDKCIPLLEGISERVEAPLVAVLMSWERGGPWVYPDCFPPVGGDESLARFCGLARERGWHVGSFCNGTRWVTKHLYNGYDGRDYFEAHHGERSVCHTHEDDPWAEHWDQSWRPSYTCCMAAELTRSIAVDFVRRLIGWGMESIQFFDQNCSAATFPCFSSEHDHPPMPGKWMARAMVDTIGEFRKLAEEAGQSGVIQSTENPCNEFCLNLFQQSDVRVSPPSSGLANFVPIYHYLFHECTILHGMMSTGGEPYALPIRNAWNLVWGEIPGAVMTGDGTLLNRETFNWAEWEPRVGSDEDSLEMIRTATAMRRGAGRDFLVYGRMQRSAEVDCEVLRWEHDGRRYEVPAVAHAAWGAPDGRHGVILANWTDEARDATLSDGRLGETVLLHACGRGSGTEEAEMDGGTLMVSVPALGCVLVEGRSSAGCPGL